jgi:hypothetical protein
MSLRTQKVLIWWSIVMVVVYGVVLMFNLHMLPPPSAHWSAIQIKQFYVDHSTEIKVGAAILSWTAACLIPLSVVIAVQMSRHERGGPPVWSILSCVGGVMMTIFFVLPPIFFGVAAFTPSRPADVTAVLHELGVMTLVSTDQFFVFMWVSLVVICLVPNSVVHSPFPRWFGYYNAWTALVFEFGAVVYLFRTGPFAWNGLLAFWTPLISFFVWVLIVTVLLTRAINAQMSEESSRIATAVPSA